MDASLREVCGHWVVVHSDDARGDADVGTVIAEELTVEMLLVGSRWGGLR